MNTLFRSSMIAVVMVGNAQLYGMEKGSSEVVAYPGSGSSLHLLASPSSNSSSAQNTPESSPGSSPMPSPRLEPSLYPVCAAGCLALDPEYLTKLAYDQNKQQQEQKNGSQ